MTRKRLLPSLVGMVCVITLGSSCSEDPSAPPDGSSTTAPPEDAPFIDPGDGGVYAPNLDPKDFVDVVANPYFPLTPGTNWVYEDTSGGERELVEVEVLRERKTIHGISATVVRDTVTIDDVLVEDTLDWFAQDTAGNVWYLGEAVKNYEDGKLVDTGGSFEHGVDGALAGVVMQANPTVGQAYRQEFYKGEAEDLGEVIELNREIAVPFRTFTDTVVTRDWNPLDPETVEEKIYARGVGLVYETHTRGDPGEVKLIKFSPGS